MTKGRPARKRPAWVLKVVLVLGWFALLFWGNHYQMPAEFRKPVVLWPMAGWWLLGLGWLVWKNVRTSTGRPAKPWAQVLGAAAALSVAVAVLAGSAFSALLLGCNGAFRSNVPFIVDGTVIAKYVSGARYPAYMVVVEEKSSWGTLSFALNHNAYEHTQLGDRFHDEFQIGLFGWPCRPR